MGETPDQDKTLELVDEELRVGKRTVERGRVVIRTRVEERDEIAEAALRQENVTVERVPVGRPVEAAPAVREEDGVLIVPVLEGAAGRHDRAHPQGGDQGHQKEPHGDRP
jgi:stress response protein YsnF